MDNSLKLKTISSLFWKIMERGGNAAVSLIVQIVLARLLTPEDFGMLAIIIVFVNIGAVFVQSGLNSALIQFADITEDDFSTVFWTCFAIGSIIYAILFFLSPYIANFYNNISMMWPLRAICLLLIINAYSSVVIARVTRLLELKKTFYATLTAVVVSGVVGVLVAVLGGGIWALVLNQLVYQIVSSLVLGLQAHWYPKFVISLKRARDFFQFGWKLLLSGILNTLYQGLSNLVIGKQFSQHELGLVSQGEKYPQAIGNMLDGAIQPVMFSAVSRVQHSISDVKGLTKRALKTSSFFILPTMGALIVVAKPFIEVVLGAQWLEAVMFFQAYCFIYALYPIQSSNLQAINGLGRSDVYLKLEIIKKIYGVGILLFAAVVVKDIYAIVIGLMLSSVLSIFVNSFSPRRLINYGIAEQLKDISPSIVLTILSASISSSVAFVVNGQMALLVLQPLVMFVLYFGLSALLKTEEAEYLLLTLKELKEK